MKTDFRKSVLQNRREKMNWLLIAAGVILIVCMAVGYARGFIRIVVSLGAAVATIACSAALTPYVSGAVTKFTSLDESLREKCVTALTPDFAGAELTRQRQIELLEAAELPDFLKNGLIENNNSEAYSILKVAEFPEYVGAYLADMILKMFSFLVTFIIVTIFVRAVIFALDVITGLPVISGLNRIAGIAVGAVIALIIIWIGFFVITLLYNTAFGKDCFRLIGESRLLAFLYKNNIIMDIAARL